VRRLTPIVIIGVLLVLVGCQFGAPAPAPTLTPLPTQTPLPTATMLPSPTATFLPSPTPVPETPEPEDEEQETETPEAPSGGLEAFLAFGSNLRTGPGAEFEVIDQLDAGEPLVIEGRDRDGFWLFVTTSIGQEGWVALRQFEGPIDVARIAEVEDVPELDEDAVADEESEDGEADAEGEETETPTPELTEGALTIEIKLNSSAIVCEEGTIGVPGRYAAENFDDPIPGFDFDNAASIVEQKSFRFFRPEVAQWIALTVENSEIQPRQCREEDGSCGAFDISLCAGIGLPSEAVAGAFPSTVTIQFGTQSYNQFFVDAEQEFPVNIVVGT